MPGAPDEASFAHIRDERGNAATKNLFIAGYGAGTTEAQLRDLVGAHGPVISVIMKGTFSFVNTASRAAAVSARQTLGGAMVNGGALRINFAKETGRLGTSFDVTYKGGPNHATAAAVPGGGNRMGSSHYGRGY